jgi:hypothetical protein
VPFTLLPPQEGAEYTVVLDTARPGQASETTEVREATFALRARSLAVLLSRRATGR